MAERGCYCSAILRYFLLYSAILGSSATPITEKGTLFFSTMNLQIQDPTGRSETIALAEDETIQSLTETVSHIFSLSEVSNECIVLSTTQGGAPLEDIHELQDGAIIYTELDVTPFLRYAGTARILQQPAWVQKDVKMAAIHKALTTNSTLDPIIEKYGDCFTTISHILRFRPLCYADLPEILRDIESIARIVVSFPGKGRLIQYASERIKGVRHIVITAVKSQGSAFQFVPAFHDDAEVCEIAVRAHPPNIRWASREKWGSRDLAMKAVRREGMMLRYLPKAFKMDPEFVHAAVKNDLRALRYVADCFKDDPIIASEMLSRDSRLTINTTRYPCFETPWKAVLALQSGYSLGAIRSPALRADPEIIKAALEVNPRNIMWLSNKTRKKLHL